MNKKIGIIIAAIIVLALIIFFSMRGRDGAEIADESSSTPAASNMEQPKGEQASLKSLLAMGKSQKCTYETAGSKGTTYISNGKMRGDFDANLPAGGGSQTAVSHMITDGTTSYMWMDGQTTGVKMDFSAMQTNPTKGEVNNSGQVNVDPNQNYDFQCSNWRADSSVFTPPASVQFTDMGAMMQGQMGSGTTQPPTGDLKTAACNNLPEPAKSQCIAAMQQ